MNKESFPVGDFYCFSVSFYQSLNLIICHGCSSYIKLPLHLPHQTANVVVHHCNLLPKNPVSGLVYFYKDLRILLFFIPGAWPH